MIDNSVRVLEFDASFNNTENVIEINDISWMSLKQKEVYNYVSEKEYMFLSKTQLNLKTDLSKRDIEKAFLDARFEKHIENMRIVADENYGFTSFEKKILEFYSNPQNVNLTPISACKLIKYQSQKWNRAGYNNKFIDKLIKLGVNVIHKECPIPENLDDLDKTKYPWLSNDMIKILEFVREYPNYLDNYSKIAELSNEIDIKMIRKSFALLPFRETYYKFNNNKQTYSRFKNQTEQRFYEFYLIEENRGILPVNASRKLFNSHNQWYMHKHNPELKKVLKEFGVETDTHFRDTIAYSEIDKVTSAEELSNFYDCDIWDLRRILKDLPMHRNGSDYIIHFEKIKQPIIRNSAKKYIKLNVNTRWKGRTAKTYADKIIIFFKKLFDLFPEVEKIHELDRENHILPVINLLEQSKRGKSDIITGVRAMFTFMYLNHMEDAPSSEYLFLSYDKPKLIDTTEPHPLSLIVKSTLDDYLLNSIIPILESGGDIPFGSLIHWDFLIILRYTGRRFGDVAHLLEDCIKYDSDGDPTLYVDRKFAKIEKDLYVPLAHLNRLSLSGRNIIVDAVERQISRVKALPEFADGCKYLFRMNTNNNELIQYNIFNKTFLDNLVEYVPLKELEGSYVNITTHMFRHTVASEMISAGVDIYAIKEFLGHESVRMTEKYVKLARKSLKKALYSKGYETLANEVSTTNDDNIELYSGKWVKNKVIGVFELGDGCCEHLYKMPSCPHMVCKTCVKKKIYPRHLESVLSTLESSREHLKAATGLGLVDKADELNNIISFYETALEYIEKDEVFIASKNFYKAKGL